MEDQSDKYAGADLSTDLEAKHRQEEARKQGQRIREWAQAYRTWNEQEIARRRATAGRQSFEEKMASFFDLCEAAWLISPGRSPALYQAQLEAHQVVQERIARFERLRSYGKSST